MAQTISKASAVLILRCIQSPPGDERSGGSAKSDPRPSVNRRRWKPVRRPPVQPYGQWIYISREKMVGVAGFEPATPASRTQCSTMLSHTPTSKSAPYSEGLGWPQANKTGEASCCMPAKLRLSRPPPGWRRGLRRGSEAILGEWCNGNTAVFGTVILGSSPSSPATAFPGPRVAPVSS